jgi:hypothetical protein
MSSARCCWCPCIALRVRRCPLLEQTVTVSTWEEGVQGIRALRNFTVEDGAGGVRQRPERVGGGGPDGPAGAAGRGLCRQAPGDGRPGGGLPALPAAGPAPGGGQRSWGAGASCPRSWTRNGHLFSANYGEVLFDCLPPELRAAELRECVLRYHRETRAGGGAVRHRRPAGRHPAGGRLRRRGAPLFLRMRICSGITSGRRTSPESGEVRRPDALFRAQATKCGRNRGL